MALLDFFRRRFPSARTATSLIVAPREDIPRPVALQEAQPNSEWEGDYPIWNWSRDLIQTAAIYHDWGNGLWTERLLQAMTREGRIDSALRRRGEGVRTFPFKFEYREGTPENIQASGEALRELWDEHVLSEAERSEIIIRTNFGGYCPCRVHKPIVDGMRVTRLEPWTWRTLVWDYSVRGWRGVDERGETVVIPREGNHEWVVFSLGGKRPWLKGMVRPLARILYQLLQTDDLWDSNNEQLGFAQKVLGVPNQIREQSEVQRAWAVVRKLRSGDVWLKPNGYTLDLLESKRGDVHMNFKARKDVLWASVAIIVLYHNLTQETKSGSLAATDSAMDLPREAAVTDARLLEIGYRAAARMWVDMNFSPSHYKVRGSLRNYAPRPMFLTKPPRDQNQLAETGDKNAAALEKYIGALASANVDIESVGIDWRAQARRCNVALLDGSQRQPANELKLPPVKYKDPPESAPAAPPPPALPGAQTKRMAAGAREPEQEEERLAGDFSPARPTWTA